MNTAIEALNYREKEVIQRRFGLIDGKSKTYKDLSKYFDLSLERIRQIEGQAIRRLRRRSMSNNFEPFTFEQLKENEYISDEEIELLSDLENEILNSNLIFQHDSIDDLDFGKDKFDTIRNIQKNIESREEAEKEENKSKQREAERELKEANDKEPPTIDDLDLSVRLFNCLKRANINTLEDLEELSYEELLKIRGLGKDSALEIIAKAKKYGVTLEGAVDLYDHDADGTTTEENFPTEIEQLAEKLKIDVKQVADITNNFGSMDNFIQMYKDGKLSKGQIELYNNKLINNMLDIDYNPLAQNYLRLVKEIFGSSFEFKLFSTDELNTAIEALNTRDKEAIQLYFGLIDGKCKTYGDLSKYFDVSESAIRGIISKAKRELHYQSRLKPFTFEQLKENEYISDEEIELLSDLENEILNSNLIFKHDSIVDLDFSKDKFDTIRDIQKNIESRKEADQAIHKEKFAIEDMGLSVRSFNCLMRGNINTLKDLEKLSYEELLKIRGLGKDSALEIIAKAKKYGVTLEGAVDLYDHDADGTTTEAKHDEKVYSNSEFEEIRAKKTELEAELKELDEQTKKARELLVKYNKLIGDDKLNTDDEAPDFKDE